MLFHRPFLISALLINSLRMLAECQFQAAFDQQIAPWLQWPQQQQQQFQRQFQQAQHFGHGFGQQQWPDNIQTWPNTFVEKNNDNGNNNNNNNQQQPNYEQPQQYQHVHQQHNHQHRNQQNQRIHQQQQFPLEIPPITQDRDVIPSYRQEERGQYISTTLGPWEVTATTGEFREQLPELFMPPEIYHLLDQRKQGHQSRRTHNGNPQTAVVARPRLFPPKAKQPPKLIKQRVNSLSVGAMSMRRPPQKVLATHPPATTPTITRQRTKLPQAPQPQAVAPRLVAAAGNKTRPKPPVASQQSAADSDPPPPPPSRFLPPEPEELAGLPAAPVTPPVETTSTGITEAPPRTVAPPPAGRKQTNPNESFLRCCRTKRVPKNCESRCNFDVLNRKTLTALFLNTDKCPSEYGLELFTCAAQDSDHTECCKEKRVQRTSAGSKCLAFCDLSPEAPRVQADASYLPCWAVLNEIKDCFRDRIVAGNFAY